MTTLPLVTVGLPVYNSANGLAEAIESMLTQTYTNLEFVISDNCSDDETEALCRSYAKSDSRVRYFRQRSNIGMMKNFEFVLKMAAGEYFLWAAADDVHSDDFVAINVESLEQNPNCVASTSPNYWYDAGEATTEPVDFALTGAFEDRVLCFLDNKYSSQGALFSVMRTSVLQECDLLGEEFMAADWAIILYMVSRGEIIRTAGGSLGLGSGGLSNSDVRWSHFRVGWLSWLAPFHDFSVYAWNLTSRGRFSWRLKLLVRLLKLNIGGARMQIRFEMALRNKATRRVGFVRRRKGAGALH